MKISAYVILGVSLFLCFSDKILSALEAPVALIEGMQAPDFTLKDSEENPRSLLDFKGKWVVLYFYPRDNTLGCTKEACHFRDMHTLYIKKGIQVIGISSDSPQSHEKFSKKYKLPFILLSDDEKNVITDYNAMGGRFAGIKLPVTRRITYLINPEGIIVKVWEKVKPESHASEILRYLEGKGV